MLKAIAIDDEPLPLELLQKFCSKTDFVSLEKTFTNISEAQKYLSEFSVDLLFLDIHMPKVSGIELYKSLKQEVMVIFTTAYSEYAIEGFNLNATDYLLKPFSYERFLTAVSKANDYYNYQHNKKNPDIQNIYVRSNYQLHKVSFKNILLIESFADYLDIHLTDKSKLTVRMPLKNIMEKLPPNNFVRVHRSFIVAINHVEKVQQNKLFIAGREIPIGTNYKDSFFSKFQY